MEYSSLFVTLMGIGTVFFGLICIIFLTMAMGAVLKGKEKTLPLPLLLLLLRPPHLLLLPPPRRLPSRRACSLRSWPRSLPLSRKRSVSRPAA